MFCQGIGRLPCAETGQQLPGMSSVLSKLKCCEGGNLLLRPTDIDPIRKKILPSQRPFHFSQEIQLRYNLIGLWSYVRSAVDWVVIWHMTVACLWILNMLPELLHGPFPTLDLSSGRRPSFAGSLISSGLSAYQCSLRLIPASIYDSLSLRHLQSTWFRTRMSVLLEHTCGRRPEEPWRCMIFSTRVRAFAERKMDRIKTLGLSF